MSSEGHILGRRLGVRFREPLTGKDIPQIGPAYLWREPLTGMKVLAFVALGYEDSVLIARAFGIHVEKVSVRLWKHMKAKNVKRISKGAIHSQGCPWWIYRITAKGIDSLKRHGMWDDIQGCRSESSHT